MSRSKRENQKDEQEHNFRNEYRKNKTVKGKNKVNSFILQMALILMGAPNFISLPGNLDVRVTFSASRRWCHIQVVTMLMSSSRCHDVDVKFTSS